MGDGKQESDRKRRNRRGNKGIEKEEKKGRRKQEWKGKRKASDGKRI